MARPEPSVRKALFFQFEGLGFLVPFIVAICVVVCAVLIKDKHGGYLVGLPIAAILLWYFGKYLRRKDGEEVIDQFTGEVYTANPPHSFFWLPVDLVGLDRRRNRGHLVVR